MPGRRDDDKVDLSLLVSALVRAVQEAKHLGDVESTRLASVYARPGRLSDFAVPTFAVTDVEVELRFAVVGVSKARGSRGAKPDVMVSIRADAIKGVDPQQLQVLRFRITPVPMPVTREGESR